MSGPWENYKPAQADVPQQTPNDERGPWDGYKEAATIAERVAALSPDERRAEQTRNTPMGEYLRELATQPREGESEEDRSKRLYGSISGPEVGIAEGMTRSLVDGASFGHGGEIVAGGAAIVNRLTGQDPERSFGDTYQAYLDRENAKSDQFRSDHPVLSTGTEITGGIASTVAAAPYAMGTKAGQVLAKAPSIVRNATVGMGLGGLAGAGYSEDGSMEDVLQGVALGGTVGVIAPVVIGLVGKFGKAAIRPIIERIGKGPQNASVRKVLEALERDDLTPEAAIEQIKKLGGVGTLVDAGPNTARLGDAVASKPGRAVARATDVFTERRGGQVNRILQRFDDAIGPTAREVVERVEESPAFLASLEKNVPVTGKLVALIQRPSLKKAWGEAQRLAREDGVDLPDHAEFIRRAKAGELVEVKTELMHWLKKGLDDVIELVRDPKTGMVAPKYGKNRTKAMDNTRKAFREFVKERNPDYGASLARISRERRIDDAYTAGAAFNKLKSPEEVKKQMRLMDEPQRRAFLRGIRDYFENRIVDKGELGEDTTRLILANNSKLRAAFGDKADDLISSLKGERAMAKTENQIMGGSQTAQRQAAQADAEIDPNVALQAGRDLMQGNVMGLVSNTTRAVSNRMRAGNQKVQDELGDILFENSPQSLAQTLAQLKQQAGIGQLRQQQLDDLTRALVAGGAQQSGRVNSQ